jgi:hypothetical protein
MLGKIHFIEVLPIGVDVLQEFLSDTRPLLIPALDPLLKEAE